MHKQRALRLPLDVTVFMRRVPNPRFLTTLALTNLLACTGSDTPSETAATTTSAASTGDTATDESSGDTTAASADADTAATEPETVDYRTAGPHPVGNLRITLPDASGNRELPVEIWYPADTSAATDADLGHPLEDFVPDEPQHSQLAELVANAPPECTRGQTRSADNATPAGSEPFPLIVMSHCHQCTRFSLLTIVERLASHGFAVVAPDHIDNTLFDGIADTGVGVSAEFLLVRSADISRVLDVVLDAEAPEVPESLRGRFDTDRVGMLGHSFGAVTTGRVLQEDDRVRAGVAIAAPLENPLLPGVSLESIDEPLLLLLAQEDNSILEIGNGLIRSNFQAAAPPTWLVEFADAGHWSFSDICDIVDDLQPGCGEGVRQTRPGTAFTYLDNAMARDIAASYVTLFFAAQLLGDLAADVALDVGEPEDVVTVTVRRE